METTIANGTFLRNGGNRYFMVTLYSAETVQLEEYNTDGSTGSFRNMSRNSFDGLVRMRNYTIVKYFKSLKTGRWMERQDYAAVRQLGLERYMVKQTYNF